MSTPTGLAWMPQSSALTAETYLGIGWMQVALSTLFCVLLGVAAIFVLRKRMVARAPSCMSQARRIRILEHVRLTPRDTLHLVEYDRRVVMLVSNATGVTLLDAQDRQVAEP